MIGEFRLFPESASTLAPRVDLITLALTAVSFLTLLVVVAMVVGFGIRYRRGGRVGRKTGSGRKWLLELAWSIPLFGVFLFLFFWAALVFVDSRQAPDGATEIYVLGQQWWWEFQHHDGTRELSELHVPAHRPILLTMTSKDVIHSLYIPGFRMKQDVLPGRYTRIWFEATKPGDYHIFCAEFCGTNHSGMLATLHVMAPEEFEKWQSTRLARTESLQPVGLEARGERLYGKMGCIACHEGGGAVHAPSLVGVYGSQVRLSTGRTVLADENYLRESIVNPQAKIVEGYEALMPAYRGNLSEEQILELIAYIRSRKP